MGRLTTITLALGLLYAGVTAHRQARAEAQIMGYRAAVTDLANTLRAMRTRAMARRQPAELQIDLKRQVVYVMARASKNRAYGRLERTIWLPEGLSITEAPPVILVLPTGELLPTTVRFSAEGSDRLFRLVTERSGAVRLHEEPLL